MRRLKAIVADEMATLALVVRRCDEPKRGLQPSAPEEALPAAAGFAIISRSHRDNCRGFYGNCSEICVYKHELYERDSLEARRLKERLMSMQSTFTPRELVGELDRHIVGQHEAKRAVAIALRNRWRRQQIGDEMREDISPKNIILIGPTGVGKTEVARRLAKLVKAPFLKVEASKFTEVGYVGRDVESIVEI